MKKLSPRQLTLLASKLEDVDYVCGGALVDCEDRISIFNHISAIYSCCT